MENENGDQEAIKQIQDMLNGNPKTKKKRGFFSKRKRSANEETKIRVKTLLDIPPLVNARRNVGNKDMFKAATEAKRDVQKDIERYFNINLGGNLPNMARIYKILKDSDSDLTEDVVVDSISLALETAMIGTKSTGDQQLKEMALKKYATFLMETYLPAAYSEDNQIDGEKLISQITDIYNYLDIKKLYFVDE
ncbi:MAG: hypothetical protein ACYCSO_04645 [Cuniculiplasma sp.]